MEGMMHLCMHSCAIVSRQVEEEICKEWYRYRVHFIFWYANNNNNNKIWILFAMSAYSFDEP